MYIFPNRTHENTVRIKHSMPRPTHFRYTRGANTNTPVHRAARRTATRYTSTLKASMHFRRKFRYKCVPPWPALTRYRAHTRVRPTATFERRPVADGFTLTRDNPTRQPMGYR